MALRVQAKAHTPISVGGGVWRGVAGGEGLGSASELTRYGVTWVFDDTYEYGAFVTGDYYVVAPSGLTVNSVSPNDGLNGSMKNPSNGGGDGDFQGLNSAAEGYNASLAASFPLALVAGDSLVSAVAIGSQTKDWTDATLNAAVKLKTIVVLTVLSSHPAAGTFRPCPCDTNKTLYNTSQLNTSILPGLNTSGMAALETRNGYVGIDYHLRGTERYWAMWGWDHQAFAVHSADNMMGYHANIGKFISETMVVMVSDLVTDTLINQFVQVGIDNFHSDNNDSSNWSMWVVMTGLLLNDSIIYNHWIDTSQTTQRDHEKFFYPADEVYDNSYTSSIITAGQCWTGFSIGGRVPMYSKQTGPTAPDYYEHLHPSEWVAAYIPHNKGEDYRGRFDVIPIPGMALAIRILEDNGVAGALSMCQSDAAIDYMDKWMSEGYSTTSNYEETGKTFRQYVLETTGLGITGDTPTPTYDMWNYNYDTAGSSFLDDMWTAYRGTI